MAVMTRSLSSGGGFTETVSATEAAASESRASSLPALGAVGEMCLVLGAFRVIEGIHGVRRHEIVHVIHRRHQERTADG